MPSDLHVLLVEPFLTGSHRAWAEGCASHSAHRVSLVSHAGEFWKWRMQGAALTLADEAARVVAERGRVDVVLASSMVHLPALLGFARRSLGDVPVALYLHENQLTYPTRDGEEPDLTYAMTTWLSMAAADVVFVASEHHRADLVAAVPRLLRRFPDHRHTGHADDVLGRIELLPVGVDVARIPPRPAAPNPRPLVVWNQRWEHDKAPDRALGALADLADDGVDFDVAVAGERYGVVPEDMEQAVDRLRTSGRLVHRGTLPDDDYVALLARSDVVVSTAIHENFGIAVVEAMAAGAMPVLPRSLSYPELVPSDAHAVCLYDPTSDGDLRRTLRRALEDSSLRSSTAAATVRAARRFGWDVLAPSYDTRLEALARSRS